MVASAMIRLITQIRTDYRTNVALRQERIVWRLQLCGMPLGKIGPLPG
jgi:hypothetical protein